MRRTTMLAAWACIAYVTFATLSPIEMRMSIGTDLGNLVEHFGAFLVIALFLGIAYPRHAIPVLILAVGCVLILEALQLAVPGRHARLTDATVKCAGAVSGWLLARWINRHLAAPPAVTSKLRGSLVTRKNIRKRKH